MTTIEAIEKFYEEAVSAITGAEEQRFTTRDEFVTVILQNMAEIKDELKATL